MANKVIFSPPSKWKGKDVYDVALVEDVEEGDYIVMNRQPCRCTKIEREGVDFILYGTDLLTNEEYSERFHGGDDELYIPIIKEAHYQVELVEEDDISKRVILSPQRTFDHLDPEMFKQMKNDLDNLQYLWCTIWELKWRRFGGELGQVEKIVNYPTTVPENTLAIDEDKEMQED